MDFLALGVTSPRDTKLGVKTTQANAKKYLLPCKKVSVIKRSDPTLISHCLEFLLMNKDKLSTEA